jgi:methionyl-tRNA formyltransferase
VSAAPDRRPRTLFVGSGAFGVESLSRLVDSADVDLVGVVTAPPKPAGRQHRLTGTPVWGAATALGVDTILTPERLRDPVAIASILSLEPALIVLADYGRIVPRELLDLPFGAVNLHPSLLPRHRGATPIPATILAGDAETGVTLMRMDAGLDTGPILAQTRVELTGRETTPELEERLAVEAASLLQDSLAPWLAGELVARPQAELGATLTRPLRRDDGRLDPQRGAIELERQVRAHQPWPGSFLETAAGRLAVLEASVDPTRADRPGRLAVTPDLRLATGDGWLVLDRVQPAGGRPMDGRSWARGRRELGATS